MINSALSMHNSASIAVTNPLQTIVNPITALTADGSSHQLQRLFLRSKRSPREPVIATRFLQHDNGRGGVERFIRTIFKKHHRASVNQFMPELLAMQNNSSEVIAAVGINPLTSAPVFCENYLDQPAEQLPAFCEQTTINRGAVVEVGNLASSSAGAARSLFTILAFYCSLRQFEWVIFTGTTAVYHGLKKTGLDPIRIKTADKQRLGHEQYQWGSYYDNNPTVMAVNVPSAVQSLSKCYAFDIQ